MLIVDAGGGTIDISSYAVTGSDPLQVEELFEPQCESKFTRIQFLSSCDAPPRFNVAGWRIRYNKGKEDGIR